MPESGESRFLINVGSNVAYFGLNTVIMLWYIPFLVGHLGVAAYGMIPLTNSVIMYAGIISVAIHVSINRFLAIDINRGDRLSASRTFNTSLALSLAACVLLLAPVAIITYSFPFLFKVPTELERDTQILFCSAGLAALMSTFSYTFGASSLIQHRFDLYNLVRLLTSVTRAGLVALCFVVWGASLSYVALGFIVSAIVGLLGDILVCKMLTPQLRIDHRDACWRRARELTRLSIWVTVGQVGFLLLTEVDLFVVNALFSVEMTGRYGSVLVFSTLAYAVMEMVATVTNPIIIARYADGNMGGLRAIAVRSMRLIGSVLALPIGLLCGLSTPLLNLWLGPEFASLDTIMVLLIGHLAVNLAATPLQYILTACNRVKELGVVTLALGVAHIGLAIVLAGVWGIAGVAISGGIVLTLRNTLFLTAFSASVLSAPPRYLLRPLAETAIISAMVGVVAWVVAEVWPAVTWISLFTTAVGISMIYGPLVYLVLWDRSDRILMRNLLKPGTADRDD